MAMPPLSLTGGSAAPAMATAQGGGHGANFTGNGLTINKTSPWVWVVMVVCAVLLFLAVL